MLDSVLYSGNITLCGGFSMPLINKYCECIPALGTVANTRDFASMADAMDRRDPR